jgi:glycosyltransferase involved in cell wall biosynthesis
VEQDGDRPVSTRMDHATPKLLSCVICAYNEESRIAEVLRVASAHPLIGEVIVVDDGSQDRTAERALAFSQVRLLRNGRNRGKSWTLARGLNAARFEYVMLLDADLAGLRAEHLDALARPVLSGAADVTLSMRGDSFYRILGVDFVSGERVFPRALLADVLKELAGTSCWGAEIFINEMIIARRMRVEVVDWRSVTHVAKPNKLGAVRGTLSDMSMARDIVRKLGPHGLVRQNFALRNRRQKDRSLIA